MKFFKLGRSKPAPQPTAKPAANPYHAVEIKPGTACCLAVQALAGKRHLSSEKPPKLPVQECTRMEACLCRYLHHPDRRVGPRRRGWEIVETRLGQKLLEQQRPPAQIRRSRGRRKDD
jgi:hypothetical protein